MRVLISSPKLGLYSNCFVVLSFASLFISSIKHHITHMSSLSSTNKSVELTFTNKDKQMEKTSWAAQGHT